MTDTLSALDVAPARPKDALGLRPAAGRSIALGLVGVFMIYSATRAAARQRRLQPALLPRAPGPLRRPRASSAMYVVVAHRLPTTRDRRDAALRAARCSAWSASSSSARARSGAQRWYNFGFIQIQPSEFTVLFIILAVATFCERRPEGLTMYDVVRTPDHGRGARCCSIVLQPDLGTSIIIVLVVAAMMVVAGVPPRFMTFLAIVGLGRRWPSRSTCELLQKYQIDRFVSFLNQNSTNPRPPGAHLRGQQRQERHRRGRTARRGPLPRAPDGARLRARAAHRLHLHRDRRAAGLHRVGASIVCLLAFVGVPHVRGSRRTPRTPWAGSCASASSSSSPSVASRTSA